MIAMTSTPRNDPVPDAGTVTLQDLPGRILVVSDLHLGYGKDPATGRYHATENFFADGGFRRLLEHYDPQQTGAALLILNGDTFDFLRISDYPKTDKELVEWSAALQDLGVPQTPKELKQSIVSKERKFGLRTNDFKSLWKLLRIAEGHPDFLSALGWWVSRGGKIAILKGNHDLELHWDLVQRGIRREIARGHPDVDADNSVLFAQAKLQAGNVYLEHGHVYESVTSVIGDPTRNDGEELNLPLGSFVNRYIINTLERLEPFLDNIKPVQDLLWALVRKHPLKLLVILWRSLPFIRRAARPYWLKDSFGFLLYFLSLLIPVVTIGLIAAALFIPGFGDFIRNLLGWARVPLSIAGVAAPYVVGAIRDLLPKKKFSHGEDHYGQGAYETMKGMAFPADAPTLYAVMGHTHVPDVQRLPDRGTQSVRYLNSGSWAPTWRETRPDLTGKTIYSFILFDRTNGHYEHKCFEWRDDRGGPVEAVILNEHGR